MHYHSDLNVVNGLIPGKNMVDFAARYYSDLGVRKTLRSIKSYERCSLAVYLDRTIPYTVLRTLKWSLWDKQTLGIQLPYRYIADLNSLTEMLDRLSRISRVNRQTVCKIARSKDYGMKSIVATYPAVEVMIVDVYQAQPYPRLILTTSELYL